MENSRRIFEETGFRETIVEKLHAGDPSKVIAKEAEDGHYTLILMGARGLSSLKRLVLGSVSSDVLYRVSRSIVGIVFP